MTTLYSSVHPLFISLLNEMLERPQSETTFVFVDDSVHYTAQDMINAFTRGDRLGLNYARALMGQVLNGILRQGGSTLEEFRQSQQYRDLGADPMQDTVMTGVWPVLKAAYAVLPDDRIAWRFMSKTFTVGEFLRLMDQDDAKDATNILSDCLRIYRDMLRRQAAR